LAGARLLADDAIAFDAAALNVDVFDAEAFDADAFDIEAFARGLRTAGLAAGRLDAAGLASALATGLRRAAVAALPAPERVVAGRFATSFATVLDLGRATGFLRVAVACLAAAATFFALSTGRRVALLATLPAVGRFPDPLAGVDAFI